MQTRACVSFIAFRIREKGKVKKNMNKTFPAVKPSTKGVNKNWRKANGKIIWPTEMKMFLVNRVKEHVSVLESDPIIDPQHKMRVWEQIYKALIRRGMPESDIRTIKKTWIGLRSTTIEAFRRLETNRRTRRNTVVISDLQRAIYEVVELSRKLKATGNSVMPLVSDIFIIYLLCMCCVHKLRAIFLVKCQAF